MILKPTSHRNSEEIPTEFGFAGGGGEEGDS